MNLKAFLKNTFGKDMFRHLKDDELMTERIKTEKIFNTCIPKEMSIE